MTAPAWIILAVLLVAVAVWFRVWEVAYILTILGIIGGWLLP